VDSFYLLLRVKKSLESTAFAQVPGYILAESIVRFVGNVCQLTPNNAGIRFKNQNHICRDDVPQLNISSSDAVVSTCPQILKKVAGNLKDIVVLMEPWSQAVHVLMRSGMWATPTLDSVKLNLSGHRSTKARCLVVIAEV